MNKFNDCLDCGFTYLPMNEYTKENCPNCNPENIIDEDELYIRNEIIVAEEINHDGNEYEVPLWIKG